MPTPTKPKPTASIERLDERVIALSDRLEQYQAVNVDAQSRQEKSFEKLATSLDGLTGRMGEYNAHLAEHIRRTDLAERRQDTLEAHQKSIAEIALRSQLTLQKWHNWTMFSLKILSGIAAIILAAQGIVEIVKFLRHT